MKQFVALALLGLMMGTQESHAIKVNSKFTDDVERMLAEADKQEEAEAKKTAAPAANKSSLA